MSTNIKRFVENTYAALIHAGRARARRELLLMSERQLSDIGVSRYLLEEGVSAYPWHAVASDMKPSLPKALHQSERREEKMLQRAERELQGYTDAELSDLGISRAQIHDVVRHGRYGIDHHRNADYELPKIA